MLAINQEIADKFKSDCWTRFGYGWQFIVAEKLEITEKSVRDYANGKKPIPEEVLGTVRFWMGEARHD